MTLVFQWSQITVITMITEIHKISDTGAGHLGVELFGEFATHVAEQPWSSWGTGSSACDIRARQTGGQEWDSKAQTPAYFHWIKHPVSVHFHLSPHFRHQPPHLPSPSPWSLSYACSCYPSCRSFHLMHSVINQCRSQLQLGWSGQTSLSLCQQGMLEITRHTTLIDAATVYTPHFRRSKMAGINSLLLDGVGEGKQRQENTFSWFSHLNLWYLILQSVTWQECVCV